MYTVVYVQNMLFFTVVQRLHTNDYDLALETYNANWRAQFWYMGTLIMEK